MKQIIQRLKRLKDDERAVSPVVGFVLMFALIMIVFTIYQSSVVPAQNEKVEFKHSQVIEGQMEQLSAAVMSTGPDDTSQGTHLQLGVEYPARTFAINPGTPVGTLSSTKSQTVTLSGLEAEVGSGTKEFTTQFLNYQPKYNIQTEETQYSVEHGMLIKDYSTSGQYGLASTGALFSPNGDQINLPLITSDLQVSQMSAVVPIEHVDQWETTVASGDTTLTLPTTLPADQWKTLLADQSQASFKTYIDNSPGISEVKIGIAQGTTINVDKISAGNPNPDEGDPGIRTERYIQKETSEPLEVTVDEPEELTISVKDRFGNPLSGVDVEATEDGNGEMTESVLATDDNGEATFTYEPAESDSGNTISVEISLLDGSQNGPVEYQLKFPPETGTPPDDLGPQLSVSKGSLEEGPTDLIFRVTPANVDIEKFSVTTKGSLEGITRTIPTHGFDIFTTKYIQGEQGSAGGLHFTQPIQFDGTVYSFDEGTRRVSSSLVQLKKFDSDKEITFTDFADSYEEADIVVTFITDDGIKRPVFIDATMGKDNSRSG